MRTILSFLVALLLAINVSAVPYTKSRHLRSGLHPRSHRVLSRLMHDAHRWDDRKPTPTAPLRKRSSYLEIAENALMAGLGKCDLQNAINYMDLTAVEPALPKPAAGLTLFQVAIGRGTQNYTCDLANATATPVPIGALATLFNFSCVAAEDPALLKQLPGIAVNLPLPSPDSVESAVLDEFESGHHYFINSTTPFFNLDTSNHQYGMGAVAKVDASDAPAGAIKGPVGKLNNGAVQWLYLDRMPFAQDDWKAVYRLNTAGGAAPETCVGQPPSFEIPYAAEYWLFK